MLTAERRRFLDDYGRIRAAEGRGSHDAAYYRALPYEDLTGRNAAQWRIRARSFDYFVTHVLPAAPCDVLDLGAGNGWLSYRLAERGHRPVALDIFPDASDGIAALRHYPFNLPAVEAEFDHLPFASGSFDLAVFASSIHYSTGYTQTLREALRCLRPSGAVVIIDSPIYRERTHGEQMRNERHARFEQQYGFRSDAIPSVEFFDLAMLDSLAQETGLRWKIHKPWLGWQWFLRPWKARLAGSRPPSNFWVLEGRRAQ